MLRLPIPLFLAAMAGAAHLPEIAKTVPRPNCRIQLVWTSQAEGSVAPPRSVEGTLEVADSGRFRFKSTELVVVSDGHTLWQWNASTGQVILRKATGAGGLASVPGQLLQTALTGSETKASIESMDGKPALRLELDVSRAPLDKFTRATLWARESDHAPLRLEVEDSGGNKTQWKLKSIKPWNPSKKDFLYTPPSGAEVIDTR